MAPISGVSRKMTMVYRYLDCLVSVFTFRTNGGNTSFGFELLSHNLDSIAVSLFVSWDHNVISSNCHMYCSVTSGLKAFFASRWRHFWVVCLIESLLYGRQVIDVNWNFHKSKHRVFVQMQACMKDFEFIQLFKLTKTFIIWKELFPSCCRDSSLPGKGLKLHFLKPALVLIQSVRIFEENYTKRIHNCFSHHWWEPM